MEAAIKNGAQVRAVTRFMFDLGLVTFAGDVSGRCSKKDLPLLKHGVEAAIKNGAQVRAFDALVVVYFRSILVEVSVRRSRKGSLLLRAGVEAATEKGAHVRITAHPLSILRRLSSVHEQRCLYHHRNESFTFAASCPPPSQLTLAASCNPPAVLPPNSPLLPPATSCFVAPAGGAAGQCT